MENKIEINQKNRSQNRSLSVHFSELRKRIIFSLIIYLVATVAGFALHREILEIIVRPVAGINELTQGLPVFTNITEFWGVVMRVSLLTGLLISFPFIIYQIIAFILPGLKNNEKKFLIILMPGSLISFYLGSAFGFFILVPPAIKFLVIFGGDVSVPLIRIGSLVQLTVNLMIWMGISFQLPIIMYLTTVLRLTNFLVFKRLRKWFVVLAFVLGAIITPTFDPVNQLIVALPIILLYEVGLILSRLAKK
ncbi:MAG: twin-arginine translocase subunit TatC [Gammaproteobacteria bacterium]|nr:twin-arginine translocase subunit TatC [Gammaproteobacteria bacterium]